MVLVGKWGDDSLSQPAADSSLWEGALKRPCFQHFPKASLSEGGGPVGAGRSPSPHILTNTILICRGDEGTGNRKSRARNVTARIKHMFPRENDVRNSKSHVAAAPAPPYILIVKRTDGGPGAAATTRTISMCSRQQPFLFPVPFALHFAIPPTPR